MTLMPVPIRSLIVITFSACFQAMVTHNDEKSNIGLVYLSNGLTACVCLSF